MKEPVRKLRYEKKDETFTDDTVYDYCIIFCDLIFAVPIGWSTI